jgi:hypothetical protein
MLLRAHETVMQSVGRIDGIVERGQVTDRREWQQRWRTAGCVAGGMLIWSVLPGTVARSLPESWHVPEWMASRTMARELQGRASGCSRSRASGISSHLAPRSPRALSHQHDLDPGPTPMGSIFAPATSNRIHTSRWGHCIFAGQ